MNAPRGETQPENLTRPLGYAPKGTSLGVVGATLLAVGVPFLTLAIAAPFSVGGLDRWLDSIPYVMASGTLPAIGFVAFAYTRALWTVRFFFCFGWALLLAYGVGLLFALAAVAKLLPVRAPGLEIMPFVGLTLLILLAPAAWFLRRALRLRYWQPGTTPDTWEAGDETPPAWSLSPRR